jgi:hypothetical protein
VASTLTRASLQGLSYMLPERAAHFVVGLASRRLKQQFCGDVTDDCLELLLRGMSLSFRLCRSYRRNIDNFDGRYVFMITDGSAAASAVFRGGQMSVEEQAIGDANVRVDFTNRPAFWKFLLSENQDVLNSLLANEVEVEGNLNYLYKFGYLARDLARRLGAL